MKKKGLAIAALWLALVLLVAIYTDRNSDTWRYDAASLSQILQTEAETEAARRAADEALAAEKETIAARRSIGQWGSKDQYGGPEVTLPVRGDTPGLNLMWGRYDVTVRYASQTDMTLRAVSAGRQPFIEDGEMTLPAAPQGTEASMRVTITDSTQGFMLSCDVPQGAEVAEITVRRVCQRVLSPDLLVYAALAGGVLTWLLVLSWDERREGVKRRRDALILACAALLASAPALMEGLFAGHDLFFHLNRIEGIASALRCGQFPARIHASTLLGYGYAASEFYPELFFYLPALLRNLGVSSVACVQALQILINLSTALICYAGARRLFGSREVAVCASVIYTLSAYRLINVYTRAAFGEALGMTFLPLLIAATVDVFTRDERRWPMMALAMTCIFMSHMLSTLFAIGFCALAALCCLPRLVREPRRILACVKAAGLTVLCSLWFVVPFLQYSAEEISTNIGILGSNCMQPVGNLLLAFPSGVGQSPKTTVPPTQALGAQPGMALLLGCALLLLARYMKDRDEPLDAAASGHLPLVLLVMGTLAAFISTPFFPWKRLCSMSAPLGTVFMQIQFPWRLIGVAAPMLSLAAACGYLARPRWARAGAALALTMSVLCAGLVLRDVVNQDLYLMREGFLDSRVNQYEYTYNYTEKSIFRPDEVVAGGAQAQVIAYRKRGTSLTMEVGGMESAQYLELPMCYYPGYRALIDGEACSVRRGENNVIRLYGAWTGETSTVQVWYEEPMIWRAAELASLAGFALLIALCIKRKAA